MDRHRAEGEERHHSVHLIPLQGSTEDNDNQFYAASNGLSPLLPTSGRERIWQEMRNETVECEVPVRVLAGNTAFVVRPSLYVV